MKNVTQWTLNPNDPAQTCRFSRFSWLVASSRLSMRSSEVVFKCARLRRNSYFEFAPKILWCCLWVFKKIVFIVSMNSIWVFFLLNIVFLSVKFCCCKTINMWHLSDLKILQSIKHRIKLTRIYIEIVFKIQFFKFKLTAKNFFNENYVNSFYFYSIVLHINTKISIIRFRNLVFSHTIWLKLIPFFNFFKTCFKQAIYHAFLPLSK